MGNIESTEETNNLNNLLKFESEEINTLEENKKKEEDNNTKTYPLLCSRTKSCLQLRDLSDIPLAQEQKSTAIKAIY